VIRVYDRAGNVIVHATFDAARREQMPQVVARDPVHVYFFARTIKRLLAFADPEYFRVQRLADTLTAHSLK